LLLLLLLGPDRFLHPLNVRLEILKAKKGARFGIPAGGQHTNAEAHQAQEEKQARARERQSRSDIGNAPGDHEIAANKNSHPCEGWESCEDNDTSSHPIRHIAWDGFLSGCPRGRLAPLPSPLGLEGKGIALLSHGALRSAADAQFGDRIGVALLALAAHVAQQALAAANHLEQPLA